MASAARLARPQRDEGFLTCSATARREQYGPSEWLVGPDPASKQNSHGSRQVSPVVAGWIRSCRDAHRSGRPLNKQCHKVAWREHARSTG